MKLYFLFIGLGSLVSIVSGQSTNVVQCLNYDGPLPLNTYVEGCINTPCQVQKGNFAVINIVFKSPRTIQSMQTLATAYLLGTIGINYDLADYAVTCDQLTNTYCPILQDEVVSYQLKMEILDIFPTITVTVELRIADDNGDNILCIRLPISVIAAASQLAGNSTLASN